MPPGIYPRKGHSEETKRKIAAGNTGKVFSQERRDAIAKAKLTHIDADIVMKVKELLEEKVCSFDAVLREVGIKASKTLSRELKAQCIGPDSSLKFFNHSISYQDGKRLLAYLRLNLHPKEIQERLSLKEKTFWGSARKLQDAHDFEYKPTKKKPGGYRQTKPELHVKEILENLQISNTMEYPLGNFYFDFHVTGTSLLIEVQGDYWHGNPIIYYDKSKLNDTQKSNIRRDHFKRKFAKENGFYVLYVWEEDLKSRPHDVKIMLETYTKRAHAKAADFKIL